MTAPKAAPRKTAKKASPPIEPQPAFPPVDSPTEPKSAPETKGRQPYFSV